MIDMIALLMIAVCICALLGYTISLYNFFKTTENVVDKIKTNIRNQEDQRTTIIEKVISEVNNKGTSYEGTSQKEIAKFRSNYNDAKKKAGSGAININVEEYPKLLGVRLFSDLKDNIEEIEEQITEYKQELAEVVQYYNTRIDVIPSSIVAFFLGVKKIVQ